MTDIKREIKNEAKNRFASILKDAQTAFFEWVENHEIGDQVLPPEKIFVSISPAGEEKDCDCLYLGLTDHADDGIYIPFSRVVDCMDCDGDTSRKYAGLLRNLAQMIEDNAE